MESFPRHVNKYSAAAASHPWAGIVVKLDDEVIEPVLPPKTIAGNSVKDPNKAVIATVLGILAPAVMLADPADRQMCTGPGRPVGPPPEPHQPKTAAWRAAVTFAFVGKDAGASDRNPNLAASGHEPTLGPEPWPSPDVDGWEEAALHRIAHIFGSRPGLKPSSRLLFCPRIFLLWKAIAMLIGSGIRFAGFRGKKVCAQVI
jgi:hypothetical protein